MTIDELKRALVEVQKHCQNFPTVSCNGCPFADEEGYCNLTTNPAYWDIDDWKGDSNGTQT